MTIPDQPQHPDPWAKGPPKLRRALDLQKLTSQLRFDRVPGRAGWLLPGLVSALLCFGHIGRWSLWQDEAFTWLLMQKDVGGMITMAGQDRHPPLYYLFVAAFRWLGDRDFALRLPSALGVVAAVGLTGWAGGRHFGSRVGLVAAWVMALSPYALLYANTARMYGLLMFWGALLFAAGLGVSRGSRPRRWAIVLGVAAAGALWTHYAGAAAIAATGLGVGMDLVFRRRGGSLGARRGQVEPQNAASPIGSLPWARLGLLVLALGLAGLSFVPWALGPLRFQLANKDAPSDRTWTVLAYLWWNFDSRVPALSWVSAGLELAGLAVAIKRRDPLLLGWVLAALVFPWFASRSGPAQNPRNYSDFLPVASVLVGLAVDAALRAVAPWDQKSGRSGPAPATLALGGLVLLAAEPLHDLWTRPVSPQEIGTGFDYRVEADVLDAATPKNGGLYFRPPFLLTQYQRYAPALVGRGKRPVDRYAWLASSRSEWVDSTVTSRFPAQCTFTVAFREVLYAAPGEGCDALAGWVEHLADTGGASGRGYVPFQLELARRALAVNDLSLARSWAERARETLVGHPAAALTVADTAMRQADYPAALEASWEAVAITRSWRWAGPAIAQAWTSAAKALEKLERPEDRARALDAANCARKVLWPWFCGTGPGSGRVMSLLPLAPGGGPPPTVAPLPALSESQAPPPPDSLPARATRLGLWPLDGEVLPSDWSDAGGTIADPSAVMDLVDGFAVLSLAVGPDRSTALACAPMVPASPLMAIRARWRADYATESPGTRTWVFFEARMAGLDGRVMQLGGSPVMERPMTTASGTSWRVDRFEFRTPPDARQVRLCLKVDGGVPARLAVDWIETLALGEAE